MGTFFLIVYILGWHYGVYTLFKKAGIEAWKAFIPLYNTWIIVEKCNISKKWFWMQLIPIAGQFVTIWITIIFVMNFGKFDLLSHTLTTFVPFVYLPYLGGNKDTKWGGPEAMKHYHKSSSREWVDAGVFGNHKKVVGRYIQPYCFYRLNFWFDGITQRGIIQTEVRTAL